MRHFIFPRDLLMPKHPDRMFADQFHALVDAGFSASLFDSTALSDARFRVTVPAHSTVIYRGWMLKKNEYEMLVKAIETCSATALTPTDRYLASHHLPNWYPLISDLTPETRVYTSNASMADELRALNWGAYFVKDYVKSLKTSRGSFVRDPDDIHALLDEMREFRGEIEGGICVRRVEDFIPESECRYFVLNGIPYSSIGGAPIPEIVRECSKRLSSKFFSVDIAARRDGQPRVVEVGDGQVSDVVGWSVERFVDMWKEDRLLAGG